MPISVDSSSSSINENEYHGSANAQNTASAQNGSCPLSVNNKEVMPIYDTFDEESQEMYFPPTGHFQLHYRTPTSSEHVQTRFSPSSQRSSNYDFRDGLRRRQVVENPSGIPQYSSVRKSESPIRKRARTMSASHKHPCSLAMENEGASCSGPIFPLQPPLARVDCPGAPLSPIDSDLDQQEYSFRPPDMHNQVKIHKFENPICQPPSRQGSLYHQTEIYMEQDIAGLPVNDRVPLGHALSSQSGIESRSEIRNSEVYMETDGREGAPNGHSSGVSSVSDLSHRARMRDHQMPSNGPRMEEHESAPMVCQNRQNNVFAHRQQSVHSHPDRPAYPRAFTATTFHTPNSTRHASQYPVQSTPPAGSRSFSCAADPRSNGAATSRYNYTPNHRPVLTNYLLTNTQSLVSSPSTRPCTSRAPRPSRHVATVQQPGNTMPSTTLCAAVPIPYLSSTQPYHSAVYGPQPQSGLSLYHQAMQRQVVARHHAFSVPVSNQYAQPQMHPQSIPGYPQHPIHHQAPQVSPLERHPQTMASGVSVPQSVAPHMPTAAPFQLSMAAAYLQTMAAHHHPPSLHPAMAMDRRYLQSIDNHMPQFVHNRRLPHSQNGRAAAMAALQPPFLTPWHVPSAASIAHPRIIAFQQPMHPQFILNHLSYALPVFPDDPDSFETFLNLTEHLGDGKPQGLSKNQIEHLVSYRYKPDCHKGDQTICVVCMCDWEPKQLMRVLPCNHEFHAKCVDKWLKSNRTCPICRADASKVNRPNRRDKMANTVTV